MKIIATRKPVDREKYDGFGPASEMRYAIADDDGKVLDDAQGYGYRTRKAASKAMWWKFEKGREKARTEAGWWNARPEIVKAVRAFVSENAMEIMRGELTERDVLGWCVKIVKDDFGEEISPKRVRFLFSKAGSKMVS